MSHPNHTKEPPTRRYYNDSHSINKLLNGVTRDGKKVTIGERRRKRMTERLKTVTY